MKKSWIPVAGAALVVVLFLLPWVSVSIPGILPGATDAPGSLQVLSLCLIYAALALSYHLEFGVAGLLSFGHALYFAAGAYGLAVLLDGPYWPLLPAAIVTLVATLALAALLGAVSLRVSGIAFAMVTLAFAQAGNILARRNPGRRTGGDEGLRLETDRLPRQLVGVVNTRFQFWLALGIVVVVYLVVTWVQASRAGRMAAATRENELRVRVIGQQPKVVQLAVFVIAAVLAALAGMGYVIIQSGANPANTSVDFTLTLLIMVVLGGVGSRWGAIVGAIIYALLDQRLPELAGSDFVEGLPAVLRVPFSQPLFILGALFVVVVMFLPGGVAGTATRLFARAGGGATSATTAVLADLDRAVDDQTTTDQTDGAVGAPQP